MKIILIRFTEVLLVMITWGIYMFYCMFTYHRKHRLVLLVLWFPLISVDVLDFFWNRYTSHVNGFMWSHETLKREFEKRWVHRAHVHMPTAHISITSCSSSPHSIIIHYITFLQSSPAQIISMSYISIFYILCFVVVDADFKWIWWSEVLPWLLLKSVKYLSGNIGKDQPSLVTVATSIKPWHSHVVKNISQSKEETENMLTDKTKQVTSGMKQSLAFQKKKKNY